MTDGGRSRSVSRYLVRYVGNRGLEGVVLRMYVTVPSLVQSGDGEPGKGGETLEERRP